MWHGKGGEEGLMDRKDYSDPFQIQHMNGEKMPKGDHKRPKENEQKFGLAWWLFA